MKKVKFLFLSMSLINVSMAIAQENVKPPTLGVLHLSDIKCGVPGQPNLGELDHHKERFAEEKELLKDKMSWWAYYGEETKLKLTAIDDEDKIVTNTDGSVFIDDNDSESSGITFEIPLNKLFGRKNATRKEEFDLQSAQNDMIMKHRESVVKQYLLFKNSVDVVETIVGNGISYKGSFDSLSKVRDSGAMYFMQFGVSHPCTSIWLSSQFTKS